MIGSAQQWYYHLESDVRTPSWRHFTELVDLCFGPPLRSNSLGELTSLRCTDTVDVYQEKFLTKLSQADPLTERRQVELFTMG